MLQEHTNSNSVSKKRLTDLNSREISRKTGTVTQHSDHNSESGLCYDEVLSTSPPLSQEDRSSKTRAETFLHGLKVILRHHDAPVAVVRSFYKQAYDYLHVPSEEIFIKRAKYLTLAPMAKYLKNLEPKRPDQAFVAKGAWRRWSKPRLASYRARNTHLWYSFLQAKRAADRVSPDIVLSNFRKHREQMLSPDPLSGSEEGEEILDRVVKLLKPILRSVSKDILRDSELVNRPQKHCFSGSIGASLDASRAQGGQLSYLREMSGRDRNLPPLGDLESMELHLGSSIFASQRRENFTTEVRSIDNQVDFLEVVLEKYRDPQHEPLEARVEAILEPLKVRTISKGPGAEYFLAKPIQKKIHSSLRRMSPFRLIGRPFDPTDLIDLKDAQQSMGSLDDHYWLSIDYSSATDGLSASLSREILFEILRPLGERNIEYFRLLLNVLAPHKISYPEVAGVKIPDVMQVNGQLMGSPLSFPILCLANLGLYLLVRSYTRPNIPVKDLLKAVLVNGDDMIYIGTEEEWNLHAHFGAKIGLAMSPGKAYIHKKYANINSVNTTYNLEFKPSVKDGVHYSSETPLIQPFFNVGLMFGKHKVVGKEGTLDPETGLTNSYSSVIDEVVRGSLPGKECQVLKQYLCLHKDAINKECRGRNLFLPVSVGGMGQTLPVGFSNHITKTQQERFAWIYSREVHPYPDIRPYPKGRLLRKKEDTIRDPFEGVINDDTEKVLKKSGLISESMIHGLVNFIPK